MIIKRRTVVDPVRRQREPYLLEPGDSFTFQADIPHGPKRLIKFPLRFLSLTIYPTRTE